MDQTKPYFSIRIVECDFYSASPAVGYDHVYSDFRIRAISKVPVIRIFGVTPTGQKACVHVHGVYPYLYIPYWQSGIPSSSELRGFAQSIDLSVHRSLQRHGTTPSMVVASISALEKTSFYGYHHRASVFLKVELFNPWILQRVSDLLKDGAVDGHSHQPFESHIPYMLQFFTDFNLQGMNLVHASSATFRSPLPAHGQHSSPCIEDQDLTDGTGHESLHMFYGVFDDQTVPPEAVRDLDGRHSSCSLEVDIVAEHILNSYESSQSQEQMLANPGLAALWEDEKLRRQAQGQTQGPLFESIHEKSPRVVRDELKTANEKHVAAMFQRAVEIDTRISKDMPDFDKMTQTPNNSFRHSLAQSQPISQEGRDALSGLAALVNDSLLDSQRPELDEDEDADISQLLKTLEDDELETQQLSQAWNAGIGDDLFQDLADDDDNQLKDSQGNQEHGEHSEHELHELHDGIDSSDNGSNDVSSDEEIQDTPQKVQVMNKTTSGQAVDETISMTPPFGSPTNLVLLDRECDMSSLPIHQRSALYAASFLSPIDWEDRPASPPLPLSPTDPTDPEVLLVPRPRMSTTAGWASISPASCFQSRLHQPKAISIQSPLKHSGGSTTSSTLVRSLASTPQYLVWTPKLAPPTKKDIYADSNTPQPVSYPAPAYETPLAPLAVSPHRRSYVALTPCHTPPTRGEAYKWIAAHKRHQQKRSLAESQQRKAASMVLGPKASNSFKFKLRTQHMSVTTALQANQFLTLLSLELHTDSRQDLLSNPASDPILAAVFILHSDEYVDTSRADKYICHLDEVPLSRTGVQGFRSVSVPSEAVLIHTLIDFVVDRDPDILVGYEVQRASWGYLFDRGKALGIDISARLSRLKQTESQQDTESAAFRYHARHTSELSVKGRIIINVWRVMRHELALTSYTFESIAFHVLHLRTPFYHQSQLRDWYKGPTARNRYFRPVCI